MRQANRSRRQGNAKKNFKKRITSVIGAKCSLEKVGGGHLKEASARDSRLLPRARVCAISFAMRMFGPQLSTAANWLVGGLRLVHFTAHNISYVKGHCPHLHLTPPIRKVCVRA